MLYKTAEGELRWTPKAHRKRGPRQGTFAASSANCMVVGVSEIRGTYNKGPTM